MSVPVIDGVAQGDEVFHTDDPYASNSDQPLPTGTWAHRVGGSFGEASQDHGWDFGSYQSSSSFGSMGSGVTPGGNQQTLLPMVHSPLVLHPGDVLHMRDSQVPPVSGTSTHLWQRAAYPAGLFHPRAIGPHITPFSHLASPRFGPQEFPLNPLSQGLYPWIDGYALDPWFEASAPSVVFNGHIEEPQPVQLTASCEASGSTLDLFLNNHSPPGVPQWAFLTNDGSPSEEEEGEEGEEEVPERQGHSSSPSCSLREPSVLSEPSDAILAPPTSIRLPPDQLSQFLSSDNEQLNTLRYGILSTLTCEQLLVFFLYKAGPGGLRVGELVCLALMLGYGFLSRARAPGSFKKTIQQTLSKRETRTRHKRAIIRKDCKKHNACYFYLGYEESPPPDMDIHSLVVNLAKEPNDCTRVDVHQILQAVRNQTQLVMVRAAKYAAESKQSHNSQATAEAEEQQTSSPNVKRDRSEEDELDHEDEQPRLTKRARRR